MCVYKCIHNIHTSTQDDLPSAGHAEIRYRSGYKVSLERRCGRRIKRKQYIK